MLGCGEHFTVRRDRLATLNATAIADLTDGGFIFPAAVNRSLGDNLTFLAGTTALIKPTDDEFGDIRLAPESPCHFHSRAALRAAAPAFLAVFFATMVPSR